ncbi:hypothetical protein [Flavobacterium psychrotrophum]|uniref:hypothetical protein n=1 Tax=Flavobacterium psychrotrophum TaxID=2294119 RepID=UPI000E32494F|nr:hypothetical protein [Flavobacterium psychrotrophum]
MKKIFTYGLLSLFAMLTGCGSGQSSAGEEEPISTRAPQNIRTSSDMNISPSNMTTSEPAIKPSDTSKTMKPAVIEE